MPLAPNTAQMGGWSQTLLNCDQHHETSVITIYKQVLEGLNRPKTRRLPVNKTCYKQQHCCSRLPFTVSCGNVALIA